MVQLVEKTLWNHHGLRFPGHRIFAALAGAVVLVLVAQLSSRWQACDCTVKPKSQGQVPVRSRIVVKSKIPGVVGFWHIGIGQHNGTREVDSRSRLVQQQLSELESLSLLHQVPVRYSMINRPVDRPTEELLEHHPHLTRLPPPEELSPYLDKQLFEFPTLLSLWEHCQANPKDVVFYIHTKSQTPLRTKWEQHMFESVADIVDDLRSGKYWVYAPTYCRVHPWCHVTGNFWWTTCTHVRRLNKPFDPHFLQEAEDYNHASGDVAGRPQSGTPYENPPRGRFMAEYWLLSDFAGPRPNHVSVPYEFNPTKNYCIHQAMGDLCRRVKHPPLFQPQAGMDPAIIVQRWPTMKNG
mmetsp:Transcript_8826/g.25433  ORF Transcript_8826/g.25433 Transcript_8826/m.25433 type:complete len:352 (-) Transcript_8826:93-1148(-)